MLIYFRISFIPKWVNSCRCRWPLRVKFLPQVLQVWGFSFLCDCMCRVQELRWVNVFSQKLHKYSFSCWLSSTLLASFESACTDLYLHSILNSGVFLFRCEALCLLKSRFSKNALSHSSQKNVFSLVCIFMCLLRPVLSQNCLSQYSQVYA